VKTKRIEVKEGNISVPIYEFSDGRYCVDILLGEKRKRITRASLDAAKVEARKLIAQIASGRAHEEQMTLAEVEDYRLADIKDAARVALEMGNSPSMLFRNYRELVTEQEAKGWFSVLPSAKKSPVPMNDQRNRKAA
jgi:hypothetical protein